MRYDERLEPTRMTVSICTRIFGNHTAAFVFYVYHRHDVLVLCLVPRSRSYKSRDSVYLNGDTWASEVMMNTYEDSLDMQRTSPIMICGGPNIRYFDDGATLVFHHVVG
jgi:hypothetical protein